MVDRAGVGAERSGLTRLQIAAFGAFGGILPTVVRLFQLLDDPPTLRARLTGLLSIDVGVLTLVYVGCAAIVASIFPYRRAATPWVAMGIGVGMPALVGALASAGSKLAGPGGVFRSETPSQGGPSTVDRLLDLLSLF